MKSINQLCKSAVRFGLAVAVVGLLCAPLAGFAQAPKGGEHMMKMLKPVKTEKDLQALEAGDTIAMSCPVQGLGVRTRGKAFQFFTARILLMHS